MPCQREGNEARSIFPRSIEVQSQAQERGMTSGLGIRHPLSEFNPPYIRDHPFPALPDQGFLLNKAFHFIIFLHSLPQAIDKTSKPSESPYVTYSLLLKWSFSMIFIRINGMYTLCSISITKDWKARPLPVESLGSDSLKSLPFLSELRSPKK